MPALDKPLNELQTYVGRNPMPADHASFWDKTLKEVEALDLQVSMEPAAFASRAADCFHLTFTGLGGSRIYAKLLRPKEAAQTPVLFSFHGYQWRSGDWSSYLGAVSQGFTVLALDCRGQGGKSQDLGGVTGHTVDGQITRGLDGGPEKLLFRHIFADVYALTLIGKGLPWVDSSRMASTGGSQGGALSLVCAALQPEIKKCVSYYPFLCDYRRVYEMDLAKAAYRDIDYYFKFFDPRHQREEEIFTTLGYIDVQFLAPRIRAEVLMLTGLSDDICPPSTQFAAYNKITSPKRMEIWPGQGHEHLPESDDIVFEFLSSV